MLSEFQWAQKRQQDPFLNNAITNVENWTRTNGRGSVPDALLFTLMGNMERSLGFQRTITPPNPQVFFALIRGGGDVNGDGHIGGVADVEAAYGRAGGIPLEILRQQGLA